MLFLDRVRPIIDAVRAEGDAALVRYAREFDRSPISINRIKVEKKAFDTAFDQVEKPVIEAIEFAVDNIHRFHQDQKPEEMWLHETDPAFSPVTGSGRSRPSPVTCHAARGPSPAW